MQKMSRTVISIIGVLVTMAAICMGFERPSMAQCGVGWTLGAGDGQVAGADVTIVLSGWQNGPGSTEGDLSGDGETDGIDLALLLSNWGACE